MSQTFVQHLNRGWSRANEKRKWQIINGCLSGSGLQLLYWESESIETAGKVSQIIQSGVSSPSPRGDCNPAGISLPPGSQGFQLGSQFPWWKRFLPGRTEIPGGSGHPWFKSFLKAYFSRKPFKGHYATLINLYHYCEELEFLYIIIIFQTNYEKYKLR